MGRLDLEQPETGSEVQVPPIDDLMSAETITHTSDITALLDMLPAGRCGRSSGAQARKPPSLEWGVEWQACHARTRWGGDSNWAQRKRCFPGPVWELYYTLIFSPSE